MRYRLGIVYAMRAVDILRKVCGTDSVHLQKNGSNGARTRGLSRVRRTLIPAELCFHSGAYGIRTRDLNNANVTRSQLR